MPVGSPISRASRSRASAACSRGCERGRSKASSAAARKATVIAELAPRPPPRGDSLARRALRKGGDPGPRRRRRSAPPPAWRASSPAEPASTTLSPCSHPVPCAPRAEPDGDGEVDRDVDGAGLGVEEAERPDVEGAAGQVDPAPRPDGDQHLTSDGGSAGDARSATSCGAPARRAASWASGSKPGHLEAARQRSAAQAGPETVPPGRGRRPSGSRGSARRGPP